MIHAISRTSATNDRVNFTVTVVDFQTAYTSDFFFA